MTVHGTLPEARPNGNLCRHTSTLSFSFSPSQDLHQTLGFLLSNDPKALFAAFKASGWGSFPKASQAEAKLKKRHNQLKAAYTIGGGLLG